MHSLVKRKLVVLESNYLNKELKFLKLKVVNDELNFQAGQYLTFEISELSKRSYSIASPPGEDLEFIISLNVHGIGSFFIDSLRKGDEVIALGPFGNFTIEQTVGKLDINNKLVFIATGTGIAPVRSMIKDLLINKGVKNNILLIWGIRYDIDTYFFLDEFGKLSKFYNNLNFIPVVSRPSHNWKGYKGHCQDVIDKYLFGYDKDFANAACYVCGRTANVNSIVNKLLEMKWPPSKIFYEKFG